MRRAADKLERNQTIVVDGRGATDMTIVAQESGSQSPRDSAYRAQWEQFPVRSLAKKFRKFANLKPTAALLLLLETLTTLTNFTSAD